MKSIERYNKLLEANEAEWCEIEPWEQEAELKAWKDAAYEWNCTTPEELRDKIHLDHLRKLTQEETY